MSNKNKPMGEFVTEPDTWTWPDAYNASEDHGPAEILTECVTCAGDGWRMWADGKMPCDDCGGRGWQ